MAAYILNVAAADQYTDALTLGPSFTATKATVTVANNAALIQVAVGKPGDWRWVDEREYFAIPKEFPITGIIGIRFRNAVAGAVAQIICSLSGPADPDFSVGLPYTGTLDPAAGH